MKRNYIGVIIMKKDINKKITNNLKKEDINSKLLFIHGATKAFEDCNGNVFVPGAYSKDVWERYYKLSPNIMALFRKEEKKVPHNLVDNKYQILDKSINFIEIPNFTKNIFSIFSIKKNIINNNIIKKNIIESDIVVARVPSYQSYTAIKYSKKYNKKLIVEVVGCPFDALWYHGIKGKFIAIPEMLLMKHYVKISPNVIYVTKKFLQKRYPTKGNYIECSDVVLKDLFQDNLNNRLNKIEENAQQKIVIGTVGDVDVKYKGHKYVIKAISELKKQGYNYEYQLVGGGNNKRLMKLANKLNVIEEIKFLGPMTHEKVLNWYKNIDIYIQPSNTEGLCRSIIEAMSVGCPCIVSNAGGNIELINEEFIFKKKNTKDFIKKLKNMNKENMIRQAKINFKGANKYDINTLNERRMHFYEKILK